MIGSLAGATLRATTAADLAAVTALFEASYPALLSAYYEPDVLARALPIMTKAQPALMQSGTFYVAEHPNSGCVSCGGWTMNRPGGQEIEPGLAHIRHFATHPAWTRRGLAGAIMRLCLSAAHAQGITRFECQSTLAAVDFYRAAGFDSIGPIAVALPGIAFPAMLMRIDA